MPYASLKKVYKFHTWEAKDCYDSGRDRFVVADNENMAVRKMEIFVEYMRHMGIELKFSRNSLTYIEDAIF